MRKSSLTERNRLTAEGLSLVGVAIDKYSPEWGLSQAVWLMDQYDVMPVTADWYVASKKFQASGSTEHHSELIRIQRAQSAQRAILRAETDADLRALAQDRAPRLKALFSAEALALAPRGRFGRAVVGGAKLMDRFIGPAVGLCLEKPPAGVQAEFDRLNEMRAILLARAGGREVAPGLDRFGLVVA